MATKIVISPSDILFTDIPTLGLYESNHIEQRHQVGSVSYRIVRDPSDPHVAENDVIQFYVRDSGKNIKGGKGSDFADDAGTPFADVDAVITYLEDNDFFFGLSEVTVEVQVDGLINYIDLEGKRAEVFYVENPLALSVSEFRNPPPVGHKFLVVPVATDGLPMTRTAIASVADNKICASTNFTLPLEGSKWEYALCASAELGSAQFTMVVQYQSNIT